MGKFELCNSGKGGEHIGNQGERGQVQSGENGFTQTDDPLQGERTLLGHDLQAQLGLGPCHVRERQRRTLVSPRIQL